MLHPKELSVIQFVEEFQSGNGKNPDMRDICGRFTVDAESIAIAIRELEISGQEDFLRNLKYEVAG